MTETASVARRLLRASMICGSSAGKGTGDVHNIPCALIEAATGEDVAVLTRPQSMSVKNPGSVARIKS